MLARTTAHRIVGYNRNECFLSANSHRSSQTRLEVKQSWWIKTCPHSTWMRSGRIRSGWGCAVPWCDWWSEHSSCCITYLWCSVAIDGHGTIDCFSLVLQSLLVVRSCRAMQPRLSLGYRSRDQHLPRNSKGFKTILRRVRITIQYNICMHTNTSYANVYVYV